DAKKGVLYLAAATNQASATLGQLWSDGYDRAHGYGDVQVFDLAPIRDGKVKEGDNLKPTATLAIGGDIRGLELSDDASALFVAFTKSQPGYKGKSHLKQYDTADRKMVKEVTLPKQAYDMRKTADGKKLVIVEWSTEAKDEKVILMSYDMSSL